MLHLSQAYRLLSVKEVYAYGRPGMLLIRAFEHLTFHPSKETFIQFIAVYKVISDFPKIDKN